MVKSEILDRIVASNSICSRRSTSVAAAAAPGARLTIPDGQAATVDQILEKYVAAIGGADSMKTVTSRVPLCECSFMWLRFEPTNGFA